MKRVLIIATSFPPQGGRNCERVIKFINYLPQFGWDPYILTISESAMEIYDHSLNEELPPNTKIFRAYYPPLSKIFSATTKKIFFKFEKEKEIYNKLDVSKLYLKMPLFLKMLLLRRLSGFTMNILKKFIFIPDDKIWWVPFAIAKGCRICYKYKIDLIFSSAPSFCSHLAALGIKVLSGKKMIADYRDLWTNNPNFLYESRFKKNIEEKLDEIVLKKADYVISVSNTWNEFLIKKFKFINKDKIMDIPNGYDITDFINLNSNDNISGEFFRISHTGVVTNNYPTLKFLESIKYLIELYPELTKRLKIKFLGYIHTEHRQLIEKIINDLELTGIVNLRGIVNRKEALICQKNSDLLLLMYDGHRENVKGMVPSKLFDYIAAKKQILALLPECRASEIIRNGKCGIFIDKDNVQDIREALVRIYDNFKHKRFELDSDWEYLKQFDRKYLTQRLATIFDSLN